MLAWSGLFAMLRGMTTGAQGDARFGMTSLPLQHLVGWGIGIALSMGIAALLVTVVMAVAPSVLLIFVPGALPVPTSGTASPDDGPADTKWLPPRPDDARTM